jgi:high-affinity Fe2+/Pb2+ permease
MTTRTAHAEEPVDLDRPMELERDETPAERIDRNFNELLGELRVALPGVQVLFAFLLTVPFAQGFSSLSGFERGLYIGVLLLTAVACALLIAPTAYHRIQFRQGMKPQIVAFANRAALLGLAFLAVAMSGAVLLITHFVLGPAAAIPIGIAALIGFGTLWYLFPWLRLRGIA